MRRLLLLGLLVALTAAKPPLRADGGFVIASRRELFVDHHLIERMERARLLLHHPTPRELVWPDTNQVSGKEWEGANLPLAKSVRSFAPGPVNQLRDPAIYEEDGRVYLLYAVKGESGIALAELVTQ